MVYLYACFHEGIIMGQNLIALLSLHCIQLSLIPVSEDILEDKIKIDIKLKENIKPFLIL